MNTSNFMILKAGWKAGSFTDKEYIIKTNLK